MIIRIKFLFLSLLIAFSNLTFSQTKVACLGNSVTFGLGADPKESSYPAQLASLLGNEYEVENFGVSGATLLAKGHNPYVQTDKYKTAIEYAPDIAIIHLGLNDTDPRNWPAYRDDFAKDYYNIIQELRTANPEVKVYVCSLTPIFSGHPRFKSGTHTWYHGVQDKIKNIAQDTTLGYIDLHTSLANRPELLPDNLHPNKKGYKLMAEKVYKALMPETQSLKVNTLLMDDMVLQRNQEIVVTGSAKPFSSIELQFGDIRVTEKSDKYGNWKTIMPPQKESGPKDLNIKGAAEEIVFKNILIGDVWLISGQSNMDFPLKSTSPEVDFPEDSSWPPLRVLHFNPLVQTYDIEWTEEQLEKTNDLLYFQGEWKNPKVNDLKEMSAIGYYFSEHIRKNTNVPIGIIQLAVGGSGIESWIDRGTMEAHPLLVDMVHPWRTSDFIMPWVRERASKNLKNAENPKNRHPFEPIYNFEAGISKLEDISLTGVLWYQGESNAHNAELYSTQFSALWESWRSHFRNANLPVFYVQLSSLNRPEWPTFRDTQRKLLETHKNVFMATSLDLGDPTDVHPKNKKPIGVRLADLALKTIYQTPHKEILSVGSFYLNSQQKDQTITLEFEKKVILNTLDKNPIYGFQGIDTKGNKHPLDAEIHGNKIEIRIPKTEHALTWLQYAWEPFSKANVVLNNVHPLPSFQQKLNENKKIRII